MTIQRLEPRVLLSGTFASVTARGTLIVSGTRKPDSIGARVNKSHLLATLNGQTLSFSKTAVKRIRIDAFAGNDRIINATDRPATLIGSGGSDTLFGGGGNDSLDAGGGNDHLDGARGANSLSGGGGSDVPDFSSQPADSFDIENDSPLHPIFVTHGAGAASDTIEPQATLSILLTPGSDIVIGSMATDMVIDAGAGDDDLTITPDQSDYPADVSVFGGTGDDTFVIDEGFVPDLVSGGPGNDRFNDHAGTGLIDGGPGIDTDDVSMPSDHDVDRQIYSIPSGVEVMIVGEVDPIIGAKVFGNELNNTIIGSVANDTLMGGGGNDVILGNEGDDLLQGGVGDDLLLGGDGEDHLYGGSGNDTLDGGGNVDRLFGGEGNDSLLGGSSNDKLYGEDGDDTLNGQRQADLIDGGAGTDRAVNDVLDTQTSIEKVI